MTHIIHHLPSPRAWYECHVGPLPPWLRRLRLRLKDALDYACSRMAAAVMDRIATDELRLAAFLLGEDFASGFGRQGALLGHMREFLLGEKIASDLIDASDSPEPGEFRALMETRQLEHQVLAGSLLTLLDVTP